MRVVRVRVVVVLLALAVVAAGCTGGAGRAGGAAGAAGPAPVQGISGPVVAGGGPTVGVKWDWSRVDRFTPYLQRLSGEAGGGVTFYELVWCDVEPQAGRADWSAPDRVVRSARQLGYTVFLKLRVGTCWATREQGQRRGVKGKTASAMPTDPDAYRAWVGAAVRRYAPLGVHEYAVENEVNSVGFWVDSPAAYEHLATIAAAAVRAADRRALVVDCGISSTAYGVAIAADLLRRGHGAEAAAAYQRYYDRRFESRRREFPEIADESGLRRALAGPQARRNLAFLEVADRLARQRVVDVRQLHFYESWDNLPALLAHLRAVLPSGFPVQAWEVGMFWPGGSGDEATRAGELTRTVSLLLAGGVRPVIWLPLAFDPAGRHADEPRYGLLEPNGGARPAGIALERLAAAAAGAASWKGVVRGDLAGVAFGRRGSSTLVVWSGRGATLHLRPRPGGRAELVTGGRVPWGGEGVQVRPEAPLLITLPSTANGAAVLEKAAFR
jgi:hypothetical protein